MVGAGQNRAKRKGQMFLPFLILIMMGLMFFAMSTQWTKMSQYRTSVISGATLAGAQLGSVLAGYGESIIQTTLGGKRKICEWSGLFMSIVMWIVVIVLVVITISTCGATTPILVGAVIAVVAATAAVVVQATYIEPKTTSMWNKMQQKSMTTEEQFVSSAMQQAFSLAVTDAAMVIDRGDYDMDRDTSDKISRFAYHYTRWLMNYRSPGVAEFEAFVSQLSTLASSLGIEPTDVCVGQSCCGASLAGACSACCSPSSMRPQGCSREAIPPECYNTPYPGNPLAYDSVWCKKPNDGKPVGMVGLDDLSKDNHKVSPNNPHSVETGGSGASENRYIGYDAEGIVFPFLWSVKDTVMNIKDFDSFGTADAGCHWCGHQACLGPSAGWYWTGQARSSLPAQPLELTRYDSVSFCTQILRGGSGSGARMDVVDTVSFVKPKDSGCPRDAENFYLNRVPKVNDTIRACGSSYKMDYHQPGVCSGLIEDDAGPIHQALRTTTGLWRPGTDMYCGGASHYGNCPTTSLDWGSPDDCSGYPSVIQESWHNDNIDDMALQFRQLAIDVSAMIRSGTIASAQSWADEAIAWIDKLVRMACNAYVWEEALEIWRNEGYADNKAWCCPINRPEDMPDQEAALCGDYSGPGESISIDPTGMPTGGTVLHDIACMDWNIGNPGKFAACETHCRRVCAEKCGENAGDCKNGTDGETGCEEQCSAETCVGNCEERYPAGTQRNNCISDCNNNSDSCEESCAEACEEARLACCTACGLGPGEEGGACSNEIINDSWYDMPEECDSEACTSPEDGACSDEASFPRAENYSDMNLAAAYNGGVGPGGCSNWFVDTEHTGYGLSKNQRAKFRKRKEYLEKAVEAVDSYMRPQFLRLAQTIDSQIPALIAALRRYLNALCDRNSGLRPLTYMWQGKAPREGVPGLWHKVEVKAWAPGACQMGSCGASTLPWVKTYKKSHGMKRCYEIWQGPSSHNELSGGGGGTVGVTVTRWDENPSGWLGFANGLGLWKMNGRGAYRAEDAIEQGGGGACIGSCADPGVTWGRSYSRTQRARYSLSGNHFVVRLLN